MQQALAEELQCPVCMELLADPVSLSCTHALCRRCAADLIETRRAAGPLPALACPLCRERTPIPGGVASLRHNIHLGNVVAQLRRHEELVAAATSGQMCGRCAERLACFGCQTCGLLCQPCRTETHVGAWATHNFTDVDTFQRAAQRARRVCTDHNKKLKLYCPKCTQLVCTVCGMFGIHKDHGCKPMDEAGPCLPAVDSMEATLQAVATEIRRMLSELARACVEVETDGRDSEAECRKAFGAFLQAIRDNTQQRVEMIRQQEASFGELQQRVTDLVGMVPGAMAEFPERLELHLQLSALAQTLERLEMTTTPLLQLRVGKGDGTLPASSSALTLDLPTLPAPVAGNVHRCGLRCAYFSPQTPVLEFKTDPPVLGLQYSHQNRRCVRTGAGASGHVSAVAREGFTSGKQQFTVRVINLGIDLMIGVAMANASRTGKPPSRAYPYYQGLFLYHTNGYVFSLKDHHQPYTTAKPFQAGSRVTMRMDFVNQTASYEVDGTSLGVVPCPLPEGPLYPAVCFYSVGQEVEFLSCSAP